MKYADFFDVLNIRSDTSKIDLIQSLLGAECLGTHFQNGNAKLYFNSGKKSFFEEQLVELSKEIPFNWEWEKQDKEDWHLAWQNHFEPVIIENRFAIVPHWQKDKLADIQIKIKPGMAFGTGHHESTWLILNQILKLVKPGMTLLDLGTGSGILAIAAIKLGAGKVDAVEFDSDCESNFKENLQLNDIKNQIQFHSQDVLTWNKLDHDLILANINRKVIEKLLPNLMGTKGKIILSGILKTDCNSIKNICVECGFLVDSSVSRGEWTSLMLSGKK